MEEYADFLESHIETWTVTTEGTLVPEIKQHFIRIHLADIDDPQPNENPNQGILHLPNLPPGEPSEFPAKEIVSTDFSAVGETRLSRGCRLIQEIYSEGSGVKLGAVAGRRKANRVEIKYRLPAMTGMSRSKMILTIGR